MRYHSQGSVYHSAKTAVTSGFEVVKDHILRIRVKGLLLLLAVVAVIGIVFMVATTMMRVLSVHVVMLTLLLIVRPFASTTDAVMALRPRLHTSPNCIRCVLMPLRVVYRFMTYQVTTAASFMRCFTRSTHKPTVARTTTMQAAYALLWWQL